MIRPSKYLYFLVLLVLWCATTAASAATCTFTSGSAYLGTPSSFSVASMPQSVTTSSGYACAGSFLSILGTNSTSVKIGTSTNNMHLKSADGALLPYRLCKSPSCSDGVFSTNSEVTWVSGTLLGLLGLFNASGNTLPITVSTLGTNVPAGIYTDSVTLNWTYIHCSIALTPLICIGTTGSGTTVINITIEVKKACEITDAPDVNFAASAFPSKFTDVSSAMSVRCSDKTGYKVNLTSSNPVNGNWRQMSSLVNNSTYYLQYQLRHNNGSVWTHLTDYSGTGSGDTQTIAYKAAVNLLQPNLPAGAYKDVVTITLTY